MNAGYGLEEHGKGVAFSIVTETKAEGKTAVWREEKKCLMVRESGQRESDGQSYFFSDRNTAVRGAEVHILLPFYFNQGTAFLAGYGLQAHGIMQPYF